MSQPNNHKYLLSTHDMEVLRKIFSEENLKMSDLQKFQGGQRSTYKSKIGFFG